MLVAASFKDIQYSGWGMFVWRGDIDPTFILKIAAPTDLAAEEPQHPSGPDNWSLCVGAGR